MNAARERILQRIQTARHKDASTAAPVSHGAISRTYRQRDEAPRDEIITRFIERVTEYKAQVHRVTAEQLPTAIAEALHRRGIERLIIPADLPTDWAPTAITCLRDNGDLTHETLDSTQGVLTGCALGIAQTGTIVLDHSAYQGRRAISLVPDYHLCIVHAEQIVGLVPEAIRQLERAVQARRPITFISGPSATSDIELNRVEGVHGPRTLEVLVVQ